MPGTKSDATLMAAVDLAREAAVDVAGAGHVGAHLGSAMDSERLATHRFACEDRAYRGWEWAVTVARIPRSKHVTICEVHLLPGADALLPPEWVPYAQRLAPGDLGAGDTLPYQPEDENLEPGFEATGDDDVDQMAFFELGLGRVRVISPLGRDAAATRWYDGTHGPRAEVADQAPEHCATCGYFLPMAGQLRQVFGVCANEWSPSDGTVVSLDHGCGAHSETDLLIEAAAPFGTPLLDDFAVDVTV